MYSFAMEAALEIPDQQEAEVARTALRQLHGVPRPEAKTVMVQASVMVPLAAFNLFLEILKQMANGNAVTIVPITAELTTQQAAEILNVSRPYVVKLLEENKLPHKKVGTHRRIAAADLFEYKKKSDAETRAAIAELARLGQEFEGY